MEYHLDRKIKLSEGPEYMGGRSWSLQELNEEGKKIGNDQQPWLSHSYFTASELRYSHSVNIVQEYEIGDDKKPPKAQESEWIYAILHSGICTDGRRLEEVTSYSMFGTDRRIKQFGLRISKTENGNDDEKCHIWGCVSYTEEGDCRDETTDDIVEIYLTLSPERFDNISKQIETQCVDILQIRLDMVSGFYSEFSGIIRTYNVKILADSNGQEVLNCEREKFYPLRLGYVREFELTSTQRHQMNPKQDLRAIDIEKIFEEPEDYEEDFGEVQEYQRSQPEKDSLMLAQLVRNELALGKIQIPVWLIFIVLCILLAKVLLW